MPNTVGPWGSSSSGVNTIPGTPTPLATVTSATWGGIGGSIASQADLQTALAAKASLRGATFTGTVQSTGGLWSVTAAGVANFTSIASGVNWGGITGAAAQASPAGGWTGDMNTTGKWKVGGNNILSNTGTTNYIWAGSGSSNALTVVDYTGNFVRLNIDGAGAATFASSVSMGALTATTGIFSGLLTAGAGLLVNPTFAAGTYAARVVVPSGAARDLLIAGVSGVTNGFTVQYDGTNMVYTMAAGGLTVGGALAATAGTFSDTVTIPTGNYITNQGNTVYFGDSSSLISGYGNTWAAVRGSSGVVLGTGETWSAEITSTSAKFAGTGQFSGQTLGMIGYTANAASFYFNNPGQYIGVGNLAANQCKIANTTGATGAWDAANPNMDLFLGYANNLVLHTGNVGTNAATLQAAVASANAPKMGTYAQMIAWTVATGTTPYWYATDVVETDGLYGKLYQWNGSSWVAVGGAQTVTGRVVAGVISAGAVGAQAIAADVALVGQVLRSTGFTAGTTTAAPTGFKMSGTAFTSYCYNGDTTGIYSTSLSSYMEIGSGCSLGGYALGSLVLGRLINAGMKVYSPGTYTWVCPPGITQVVVTLSGGGGSGCHDASNPGGGGGAGCLTVISSVTPGTSYTVVCGAGGAGTSTTSGNDGGNSTFNGLTAQGGAAGHTGGGGYGGGAGPLGQMTSGNGVMAQMATGAVYIMCGQGARGGGGGTDPGSTQWQTGTGFGVGGGSSAAGPGYGSGSDGKTSGSTTAGGQGVVILSW